MKYLKPVLKELTLSEKDLKKILVLRSDKEIFDALIGVGISKEQIIFATEHYYETSYIDLTLDKIDIDIFKDFSIETLKAQLTMPYFYDKSNNSYYFAISELLADDLKESIKKVCSTRGIDNVVFKFAFGFEIESILTQIEEEMKLRKTSETNAFKESDTNVIEWVNQILAKGIELQASDIHIEPQEKGMQVRYRIDGILSAKEAYAFEREFINNIMIRIKVISGLDISEKRRPQDGRIGNFEVGGALYDFRVSTVSTKHGEKVVFRIFNKKGKIPSFSELGFSYYETERINDLLQSKYGIMILAGATGSGKTTTLYTMIQAINSDDINIYTIEDPIEKTIKNVNQIQIDAQAGVDYPSSLKALLRQDPDVIVVGEIRDHETAELAIKAALTGHLVLSTIHANNSIETLSRLYNMGIEPYLLSAAALGFSSQRLVRVLCPHCKVKGELTTSEKLWLSNQLEKHGKTLSEGDEFYRAGKCSKCNHIGYKGRIAVTETITITDQIKEAIAKKEDINKIQQMAKENGFVPLEVNGYMKAQEGITSIEELMRAI